MREAAFKTLAFSVPLFNLFANLKGTTRIRKRQKCYTLFYLSAIFLCISRQMHVNLGQY